VPLDCGDIDTLHQHDSIDTADAPEPHAHATAVFNDSTGSPSSPSKDGTVFTPCMSEPRTSLQCDFEGCTHKGTFRRHWELQRHTKTKHPRGSAAPFVCRAEGCFNKRMPWTFTRSDKLTSHIKSTHAQDKVFTACPVNGCDFGESTLETLGVHIHRAHKDCEEGRAVLNATTCKVRECPLWRCRKNVKATELLRHVAEHEEADVLAATSRLESEGLVVVQPDHAQRGLVITATCPMCNTMSDDIDHFITHLWTNHLFLAGSEGVDHFKAWKSTLLHHTFKFIHGDIKNLLPWADLRYTRRGHKGPGTIECSLCLLSFGGPRCERWETSTAGLRASLEAVSTHHLSLLRPEAEVIAELYPYRMQILKLYPEFVSHPAFADFDEPQDGIASSSQEPSQSDSTGFMEGVEDHGRSTTDFNTLF
jgi:hypothetical protein